MCTLSPLIPVEASDASRPPTPDFSIGALTWPVGELAQNLALRLFRDALRATCGNSMGLATTALAARSRFGNPSSEFVNVDFDPVAHLEQHMGGGGRPIPAVSLTAARSDRAI